PGSYTHRSPPPTPRASHESRKWQTRPTLSGLESRGRRVPAYTRRTLVSGPESGRSCYRRRGCCTPSSSRPAAPEPPVSIACRRRWRPRRRRLRQPERPLRPPPTSSASLLTPRYIWTELTALPYRRVENAHPARSIGGWNLVGVDDGLTLDGVRKVLDAV